MAGILKDRVAVVTGSGEVWVEPMPWLSPGKELK